MIQCLAKLLQQELVLPLQLPMQLGKPVVQPQNKQVWRNPVPKIPVLLQLGGCRHSISLSRDPLLDLSLLLLLLLLHLTLLPASPILASHWAASMLPL